MASPTKLSKSQWVDAILSIDALVTVSTPIRRHDPDYKLKEDEKDDILSRLRSLFRFLKSLEFWEPHSPSAFPGEIPMKTTREGFIRQVQDLLDNDLSHWVSQESGELILKIQRMLCDMRLQDSQKDVDEWEEEDAEPSFEDDIPNDSEYVEYDD